MSLSVFDLFKIGIGPSSSHTVGPMWAAHRFLGALRSQSLVDSIDRVRCELYGSLALTGIGHATDKAILLGLMGETPPEIDPDTVEPKVAQVRATGLLPLGGDRPIRFVETDDLIFRGDETLPFHPNGIRFRAFAGDGELVSEEVYYSVGGGFVVGESERHSLAGATTVAEPYPFENAAQLLTIGRETGLTITEIVRANETIRRSEEELDRGLDRIWDVMEGCIERGCRQGGILPGGLNVRRRASRLYQTLLHRDPATDPLLVMDWVSLFALAVNEENAAGGRVVTAPTNGGAGVVPAVIAYYKRFVPGANAEGIRTMLLVAAAIGFLYKKNASISAAEMGCQGEVGVACSMAAGGLAAALGGSNEQVENAAEIGMEHNLGLTCDPILGLVQVPCIERNAMGASKAINAARLALHGDGQHHVPLDRVIETMRQVGHDMQDKYKETSRGGLAVNVVNC